MQKWVDGHTDRAFQRSESDHPKKRKLAEGRKGQKWEKGGGKGKEYKEETFGGKEDQKLKIGKITNGQRKKHSPEEEEWPRGRGMAKGERNSQGGEEWPKGRSRRVHRID